MQNNMNTQNFGDKEMMDDALSTQKFMTDNYNTTANECSNDCLRTQVIDILNDEHQIQFELFQDMQRRGWYQTTPAEQAKITKALQKFQGNMMS